MNTKAQKAIRSTRNQFNLDPSLGDSCRSPSCFLARGGSFNLGGRMYTWRYVMGVVIFTILATLIYSSCFAMDASWYSRAALARDGQDKITHFIMANGKEFFDEGLTCAAGKQYKLNTYLRIRNNDNGKEVVVKVTDRLNRRFYQTRIDLSKYAFSQIASLKQGIVPITVEVIE